MELKDIRQQVFRYLVHSNNSVKIDDCIALIIAEILGYLNKENKNDFPSWSDLCFEIKNYKTLCKEGLIEKIKHEILDHLCLEKKRELLGEKGIYTFEYDNVNFSQKFIDNSKGLKFELRKNYGRKSYSKSEVGEPSTVPSAKKHRQNLRSTPNRTIIIEEEELAELWNSIYTDERRRLFPFWKWKISTNEFESLQSKLIDLLKVQELSEFLDNHAFKIALYYSEWFKREYIGNDSKIDPVFAPIRSQEVWERLNPEIRDNYLTRINTQTRWDDSLRLLGGLPLSYLIRGGNNTSRIFAVVFNDFGTARELDLTDLDIHNQTMLNSARPGGSIYEYVQELINENYPIAEADKNITPFKEFITFVEDGLEELKKNKTKKFSLGWQVKQHPDFVYLYPSLKAKLKPEENGVNHNFISDERLAEWGVSEILDAFEIVVRLGYFGRDIPIEKQGFYFNRCVNGNFLSRTPTEWEICDNPKDLNKVQFVLKFGDQEMVIQNEVLPNFVQLWSSGYGEWTNRQINGSQSSVLFLNSLAYPKDGKELNLKSKETEFKWAIIDKELRILDNENEKKLFQKNGGIEVSIKNILFKNIIDYNREGKLTFKNGDETSDVYLIKSPEDLQVAFIDRGGLNKENLNPETFTIKFKTIEESYFKEFDPNEDLEGYVTLEIRFREVYRERIDCYFLKKDAKITRKLENKTINFQNISFVPNILNDDEGQLEDDIIGIKIGTENQYLQLPVFRSLNRNNDLFHQQRYIANRDIIPVRFTKGFEVRSINNEGVTRIALDDKIDKFQKARVIYKNSRNIKDQTGIGGMPDWVRLTTYTKEFSRHNNFYFLAQGRDISLESFSEYKFCFLDLDTSIVKELQIEYVQENNQNYISLQLNEQSDGILFQSFKENYDYQETYRPVFVASNRGRMNNARRLNERTDRITNYRNNYNYDLAINHFNLAIEHNLYFGMFDILIASENDSEILAKFYIKYCEYCKTNNLEINYEELHRFALEMLFDWILIPRKIWYNVIANNQDYKNRISKLFRTKKMHDGFEQNALNECSEKYWYAALVENKIHILYQNIKRTRSVNLYFEKKPEEKIRYLIDIDSNANLYELLRQHLN